MSIDVIMNEKGQPLTTTCPHCGELRLTFTGWLAKKAGDPRLADIDGSEDNYVGNCPCPGRTKEVDANEERIARERLKRETEQVNRAIEDSGLSMKYCRGSLADWAHAVERAEACRYGADVVAFLRGETDAYPGNLTVSGGAGAGKTTLVHLLGKELIKQGVSVTYERCSRMLRLINNNRSKDDMIEHFAKKCFLILDDLGDTDLAEWHVEQLVDLLETRKDHNRPTIITTRFGSAKDLFDALTPSGNNRKNLPASKLIRLLDGRHVALQPKRS